MPKKKTPVKKTKAANKKPNPKQTSKKASKFLLAGKFNKSLTIKNSKRAIIISAAVFFVVCLAAWWQFIFADPSRVISDMLVNNLRTPGLIKTVNQSDAQNSINQQTYISFIDGTMSQSVTKLEQADPTGATNRVTTENIGTVDKDYIQYRMIDLASGSERVDLSKTQGVWASKDVEGESSQSSFLAEGLFGVIAFANMDKHQAAHLQDHIKEKGLYDYTSVNKKFESGRIIYEYKSEILPIELISYLAEYSEMINVDHRGQLDPQNYVDAPPIKITLAVDVISRQLKSVSYDDTGRVEEFSSFGLKRDITLPDETITIDALQQRLQP